jgi:hypothetical protein
MHVEADVDERFLASRCLMLRASYEYVNCCRGPLAFLAGPCVLPALVSCH